MPLTDEDRSFISHAIDRAVEQAVRTEMLTVGEIMHRDKIKTRETVKARAERRGIPERTIGGGLRTSPDEPLRYSRAEWEAGEKLDTRRVKRYARDFDRAA